MVRMTHKSRQRRMLITMAIYATVFLWAWPLARVAADAWVKMAYALAPVPPVLYAIWLLAQRVLGGDELEQRTHLIGIGVSAAVVSVFGVIGGFLAAANVLPPDWAAAALVWIFPLMTLIYVLVQGNAARRYGSVACYEEGLSLELRFLYAAAIFAVIAAYVYFRKGNEEGAGAALGMAAGMTVSATLFAALAWWRRRSRRE